MEPTPWDPEGVELVLDPEGRLAADGAGDDIDLKGLYKLLVTARTLDIRLGRRGLPLFAPSAGEEAATVLPGLLAQPRDWIFPGERDIAVGLGRGLEVDELVHLALGRDTGAVAGRRLPGRVVSPEHRIAPGTDALGMHVALAAGCAQGQRLASAGACTLALLGEGTTTAGSFHESIALAVRGDLPLVLVCKSQLWPDGAPAEAGLLGDSVAERVRACGLWARRVDGADVLGVHTALGRALDRARRGGGPALVEVVVTQLVHDPPPHRDPIERLRRLLDHRGEWTPTFQDVLEAEVRGRLDRALRTLEEADA